MNFSRLGWTLGACVALLGAAAEDFEKRWAYVSMPMTEDANVALVSNVVQAAGGRLNGIVLSCGLDFVRFWPQDRFTRLDAIRKLCADNHIEIIPAIWSFGYGALQNYSVDALEGVPVQEAPFVARGQEIVFDEGAARVQKLEVLPSEYQKTKGFLRLIQKLKVTPNRRYRYRFEYRTTGVQATQPFKVCVVDVNAKQWHEQERTVIKYESTQDWTLGELTFNSLDSDSYYCYTGFWSGVRAGDLELRNLTLAEVPPQDVLRRPGTPRVLKNAITGQVYVEGRDYTVPRPKYPVTRPKGGAVVLGRPEGSTIPEGAKLLFDSYAPAVVDGEQVSMCLSEPEFYTRIVQDSAERLEKLLSPKTWLISNDEFRNGGTCAACRARGLSMGEIYAAALTKFHDIIHTVHPGAEVCTWSDMLDPGHNGVPAYYNCRGSFEGAWKGVPKDITMVCWYNRKCESSLKFFSDQGFKTLAAAYYDEKPDLVYSRRWRDAVRRTPQAQGIMYTTWRHAYADLPAFMKMIDEPTPPPPPLALTNRWVYLPCHFWGKKGEPHSLEYCTNLAARAKRAGYNGLVLASHFDLAHRWPPHLSNQVIRAKAFCDQIGMEIIPMMWDVGYGGDCPGDWFESRTVTDMPYVRRGNKAVFSPEPVPVDSPATGYLQLVGVPDKSMPMRPSSRFRLKKGVGYVVTVQAKATGVPEKDKFQFIGFIPSVKGTAYYGSPAFPHDGAWHELVLPLVAKSDEEVTMVFGCWGREGTLELKDFTVRQRGVTQVTRRPEIPFVVKDAKTGNVYAEGRDYAVVPGVQGRSEGNPAGPYVELTLPAGSRIVEGCELLVTADTPDLFRTGGHGQYAACMSNPAWYRRAREAARAVKHLLQPKRWFLCFDELRSANLCAACRARNLDMARLIGDCLTQQYQIVQGTTPGAECYVWGDMLDPNHNAHEGYAHTRGSYVGIASCIPKELVIVPWWGKKAAVQTDYWTANGFRICPGAYYDQDSHAHDRQWLSAARPRADKVTGFIFCTWKNNFNELENFAELMFGPKGENTND